MKICKKCNKRFNVKEKIDGKIRVLCNRKYCLECSPFGKHNTRQIHLSNRIQKDKSHKWQKEYRRKRRYKLIELLGGKCQKCGYNKCNEALAFHHISADKLFEVNSSIMTNYSWDILVKEAKKCRILCLNCHAEEHYGDGGQVG